MLSYIYMFAPEVVGQHVLAFLNLKSLVQLDTAIMDNKQRPEFLQILQYCPPVAIHQGIQASNEELLWFKQRKCRIKEMKLSLSQPNCYKVDTNIADRVALKIQRTILSSDIETLSQSDVVSIIHSINISGEQDKDIVNSFFILVRNLKSLSVISSSRQEGEFAWLDSFPTDGIILHSVKLVFSIPSKPITNFIN